MLYLTNIYNKIRIIIFRKLVKTLLTSNSINKLMSGKVGYQGLFEQLHKMSLNSMNIGLGASPELSGETFVMTYIHDKLCSKEGITIFDIGANVGEYATLLQKHFGRNVCIYCFEPSVHNYNKLLHNIEKLDNIQHYNFGFGSHCETVTLFSEKNESKLASVYDRKLDHFNIELNYTEEISIRTVDEFCEEHSIKHINFLKVDVEGHEIQVLLGAEKLIDSNEVDFIQFEFGGCNIDSKTYFQDFFYLLKDKYHIYRIVQDGVYKIDLYKEEYELFLTTNFLAERIAL